MGFGDHPAQNKKIIKIQTFSKPRTHAPRDGQIHDPWSSCELALYEGWCLPFYVSTCPEQPCLISWLQQPWHSVRGQPLDDDDDELEEDSACSPSRSLLED